MKKLKIGFIGFASNLLINESNKKIYKDSKKFLSELVKPHKVEMCSEVFLDNKESQQRLNNLIENGKK